MIEVHNSQRDSKAKNLRRRKKIQRFVIKKRFGDERESLLKGANVT